MGDPRIWQPDHTCNPFLLETVAVLVVGSNKVLFKFRIPDDNIGVITNVAITIASANKATGRIVILEGDTDQQVQGNMKMTGALQQAYEYADGIVWFDGFALFTGARPCRIILQPGTRYRVAMVGTLGFTCPISLNGYTFPILTYEEKQNA